MASIHTDEGLDDILGVYYKAATQRTTLYVGLFTSQSPTTVPARTATGGASPSGITEMTASSGTYARQAVAAANWGTAATNGSGRQITKSAPVTFTGFVGAAAANGFFLATASASGAGDKIVFAANFASGVARTFATTADSQALTPSEQFNVS